MKMFDEYQRFTETTAVYPQVLAFPYLALGLCDEAGELYEKMLAVMDLPNPLSHHAKIVGIVAEIGDVCWYIARLSDHFGWKLSDLCEARAYSGPATVGGAAGWVSIKTSAVAGRIKKMVRDGEGWSETQTMAAHRVIQDAMQETLGALEAIARFTGHSLAETVHLNQLKLADRLSRNVIKGDGDSR